MSDSVVVSRAEYEALRAAVKPFAEFAEGPVFKQIPDSMPMTKGSALARRQVTAGDFKRAFDAYFHHER